MLKEKIDELSEVTERIVAKIRELLGTRKIFGTLFIYEGMDYIKVVLNEMRQLRTILSMYGID